MYPLKNWNKVQRTYVFGVPTYYSDFHLGIDFILPEGTPLYAPFDGEIIRQFSGVQGGLTIWFKVGIHIIRFLHLSNAPLEVGPVQEGSIIGYTGNTGLSTDPHLHLDISKDNVILTDTSNFVDPDLFDWNINKATYKALFLDNRTKPEEWTIEQINKTADLLLEYSNNKIELQHDRIKIDENIEFEYYRKYNDKDVFGPSKAWMKEKVDSVVDTNKYDGVFFLLDESDWEALWVAGWHIPSLSSKIQVHTVRVWEKSPSTWKYILHELLHGADQIIYQELGERLPDRVHEFSNELDKYTAIIADKFSEALNHKAKISMKHVILPTLDQYVVDDTLKLALSIANNDELAKLQEIGLGNTPVQMDNLDGYLIYHGGSTEGVKKFFNI